MNRFRWLTVCVAMGCGVAAWGQKIELKVNYEPGPYVMTQTMAMDMTVNVADQTVKNQMNMVTVMDMSVGKADADTNREIKVTFRQMKVDMSSGGKVFMKFDSAVDAESKDPMARMYNAMIGKTLSMTLDTTGKASNLKGMDELFSAMVDALPGEADESMKANMKGIGNSIYEGFSQSGVFPDKPVAKGDTWEVDSQLTLPMGMPMQVRQVNTLKAIKDGVATVESKAVVKMERDADTKADAETEAGADTATTGGREMNMTIDSTALVTIATGLAETTTMTQTGTFVMSVGEMEMQMTMDGEHKITIAKGAYKPAKPTK